MTPDAYEAFTESLRVRLEEDPRVLGLVALGSMARQDYEPDRWSDHDFFVITRSGEQEAFRGDRSWLPRSDRIVLSYRETPHGVKACSTARTSGGVWRISPPGPPRAGKRAPMTRGFSASS